jgi:hypothetical protein
MVLRPITLPNQAFAYTREEEFSKNFYDQCRFVWKQGHQREAIELWPGLEIQLFIGPVISQ